VSRTRLTKLKSNKTQTSWIKSICKLKIKRKVVSMWTVEHVVLLKSVVQTCTLQTRNTYHELLNIDLFHWNCNTNDIADTTHQQVAISMIKFWKKNSSSNSTNYMAELNLRHEEINGARINEKMRASETDIGTKTICKQHWLCDSNKMKQLHYESDKT